MNGYTFLLALVGLAVMALLIAAVANGSLLAGIVLAVLVTVLLISTGAGITLLTQRMAIEKSQIDFINNAKENLAIMQSLQRVQNQQNATLMQQLGQTARLPEPARNGNDSLIIDAAIFDELED